MTPPPVALLAAAVVAAAIALAACGGDDDEDTAATEPTTATTTAGATGPTGAEDDAAAGDGASYDITASEFIESSLPDQVKAVQDYVEDSPDECGNVDTKGGSDFQVAVAINAATAEPDTPLADVILRECEQGS
jgi:hypothetical protein